MDECLYMMNVNYKKGYDDGTEDTLDKIRDAMTFHQSGLSGYFTISQDKWNYLEEKLK